jgi:hypothetical protein
MFTSTSHKPRFENLKLSCPHHFQARANHRRRFSRIRDVHMVLPYAAVSEHIERHPRPFAVDQSLLHLDPAFTPLNSSEICPTLHSIVAKLSLFLLVSSRPKTEIQNCCSALFNRSPNKTTD